MEGFIFYRSFAEALKDIPAEQFKTVVMAISDYALDGVIPEDLDVISKAIFTLVKPQIDANVKKREAGRKGGEANRSTVEANVKQNEAKAKQTEAEPKQTEAKVKVKDKEKVKEEKEKVKKERDVAPEVAVATLDAPQEVKERMQGFVDMRKSIRKPMTGNAVRLIYGRLLKFSSDPNEQCQILEQSIRNGWQDVYALKTESRASPGNKFTNIIKHDYDFDELEKALINA